MYINVSLASIAEIIAYFFSGWLRQRVGLKLTLVFSFVLSSLGMILITFYETTSVALLATFILISKFGVASSVNMMYTANVQLFPITIVGTSFGICNFFARTFTILSPYIAELKLEFTIFDIFY